MRHGDKHFHAGQKPPCDMDATWLGQYPTLVHAFRRISPRSTANRVDDAWEHAHIFEAFCFETPSMKRCVKQKENPLQNDDVWTAAAAVDATRQIMPMSHGPVESGGANSVADAARGSPDCRLLPLLDAALGLGGHFSAVHQCD
jgi:hypothetical protein